MHKHKHVWGSALVAIAASTAFDAASEDTIRCRSNRLVNVGMQAAQVVGLCGEPKSRSNEDVPVRARGAAGGSIVIGTTRVERWIYSRGQGQFDALLSFEDGELVRIDVLTTR
jgi:hypothetical protein